MRISDWSSDVCSSDLHRFAAVPLPVPGRNLMSAICRDATFLGANPFAHYIRPMTNFRLHQPGIVGAGRVAQALALALRPHAIAPPMLWGRSPETARSAAAGVGEIGRAACRERVCQSAYIWVVAGTLQKKTNKNPHLT